MELIQGEIMTVFREPDRELTLDEIIEVREIISKTWMYYLPEYNPSGSHFRAYWVQYCKEFMRKVKKTPNKIRFSQKKINFIIHCKETSDMVRRRKLSEKGMTISQIRAALDESL